jgi:aquaporin Z
MTGGSNLNDSSTAIPDGPTSSPNTGTGARTPLKLFAILLTEFVGTGFAVLVIGLTGLTPIGFASFDPLSVGFIFLVMVYMGGHISGAHYNPAVTLSFYIRGVVAPLDALMYVVAQLAGAAVFGITADAFVRDNMGTVTAPFKVGPGLSPLQALLAEFVLTFSLTNVALRIATLSTVRGNSYSGLAIGFTILSSALCIGGISGSCLNPAVSVLNILASFEGEGATAADYWLYWVGPLLGGVASGLLFRFTNPEEIHANANKAAAAPYIVEFVGTFMLCFAVATAAAPNLTGSLKENFAPVAIGGMLMSQVYAGGPTSGGHYNPAVTAAVFARSRMAKDAEAFPGVRAIAYIAVQCSGALLGGAVALLALDGIHSSRMPDHTIGAPYPNKELGWALLAEAFGTFALALVVFNVAVSKDVEGNSYFGIAIGLTVSAMAFTLGHISGGAFNPAVGLLQVINLGQLQLEMVSKIWIFWVAPYVGGFCAVLLFHLQSLSLVVERVPLLPQ